VRGRRPLWDLARAKSATRAPLAPTLEHPLDKNKIAVWCLIASETGFFIILIFAYVFYNLTREGGPTAEGVLDATRTGAFTVCLLSSSVTLTLAERRLAKGNHAASARWLLLTVFLGFVFLVGQGGEYLELWHRGVTINRNIFATTFFTLTGFHGLHVAVGLIVLATFTTLVARGDYKKKPSTALVAAGLYWHFVDVVWIAIFTLVYLIR
jgi:heme/copper-type cytochrome/quinol oxidase subunit 3